uniref:Cytochrome c oxidase subunit 2 n=1 Tax=Namalycastis abiuma TaxID=862681 RepID=A0A342K7Y6_9ANNE|nr:cytochrome c oxidase subunit II [Namalycastis abiuma]AMY15505.1 cytochrome c oxidase subunit II [Namalycastis abiuma]
MPHWGQLLLQDAVSPIMSMLISFHDHAMLVLIMVITFVGYALMALMMNSLSCRHISEAQEVETIWTILPAGVLLFLALPSLRLLYLMDEVAAPGVTVKAVGHQWYWSYEYSDFTNIEFDSYMTPTNDLEPGQFRLLEVDNRTILPVNIEVRMLITAADVIHSWTIPALGVKADAIPGRLNQIGFIIQRPGIYYGQCSEICGANHSFMPIAIEAINNKSFINWITSFN